jgi:2,4-didehydro-3-deoxy-L-rhamnonate hydrolase
MKTKTPTAPAVALGTFTKPGASPFPGLVLGERVTDLSPYLGPNPSTISLFDDWDASLELMSAVAASGSADHSLADLHPCVPLEPRQVLCAGANYYTHVVQMASAAISSANPQLSPAEVASIATREADALAAGDPFIFIGLPSALVGAEDDIVLWGGELHHDWELELAVVIGRGGRDIPVDRAMQHVAGYTIANDITTRNVTKRGNMPYSDLLVGKNRRTFFPVGPFIVPRADVPDPDDLRIVLRVNGDVMQDDSTSNLVFGVDELISYASTVAALYPGDLILTGSPSGNAGHHGNRWLTPGDVIEAEISGLGQQRNRCVADNSLVPSTVTLAE